MGLTVLRPHKRPKRIYSEAEEELAVWGKERGLKFQLLPPDHQQNDFLVVKVRRRPSFWEIARSYVTATVYFDERLDCYCIRQHDRTGCTPCLDIYDALTRIKLLIVDVRLRRT